ncbi:hypothetical protein Golomagni_03544 [Golovinomyces magnicellulatus]|nr:hypothetical protein Golomagni_03544 [Golovinomyces magnicellulatus]
MAVLCTNSEKNRSNRVECPCGKLHNIPQCNYLNPNRKRPHWWKQNKELKAKIESYCKNDPEFAQKVWDQAERWESERKSKGKTPETTAEST